MKRGGIIGGVGPSATVDLYRSIIKNTPARKDQNHIRIIIDNHPQIPDRTEALLYGGESPDKHLIESIRILQNAEVDFMVCPCNTAHVFLRQLKKHMNFLFIDMIEVTIQYLKENHIKKAGLLSTSGTAKAGIYQDTAKEHGIEIFIPSEEEMINEMEAISGKEGIKASVKFEKSEKNKAIFLKIIEGFKKQNAQSVIMGCTEIPLCLDNQYTILPLINPTDLLAKAFVKYALS